MKFENIDVLDNDNFDYDICMLKKLSILILVFSATLAINSTRVLATTCPGSCANPDPLVNVASNNNQNPNEFYYWMLALVTAIVVISILFYFLFSYLTVIVQRLRRRG